MGGDGRARENVEACADTSDCDGCWARARACSCSPSACSPSAQPPGYAVKRDDTPVVARLLPRRQGRHAGALRGAAPRDVRQVCKPQRASARVEPARHARPGRPRGACGPRRPRRSCRPAGRRGDCDLERRIANGRAGLPDLRDVRAAAALQRRRLRAQRHARAGDRRRSRHHDLRHRPAPISDDYYAVAAGGTVVTATLDVRQHRGARGRPARQLGQRARERRPGSSPQSVSTPGPVAGTVYVRIRAVGNAQGELHAHALTRYRGAPDGALRPAARRARDAPLRRHRAARARRVLGAHARRGARARGRRRASSPTARTPTARSPSTTSRSAASAAIRSAPGSCARAARPRRCPAS